MDDSPHTATPMTICVIDDIDINLTLVKHLVARLPDCTTQCFSDARQGLAWCGQHLPDLLIVDYMMPDLDGIALIDAFRKLPGRAAIPILMVTANDEVGVRYKALEAGANDFLSKPLDRIEFMARTRNMLALRQAQRRLENHAEHLAIEVRRATQKLVESERETIVRLARAAEYRDPETGHHILRMAHFSRLIAAQLGMSEEEQELILDAAPMHDIGKVGIPDHILLKKGRLEGEELRIMQGHAELGYRILAGSSSRLLQVAAQIAISHHEKFDGSGYPNKVAGDAIPIHGRIVAVADIFDALCSTRPYKTPWPEEKAVAYLRENAGKHFDDKCVEAFIARIADVRDIQRKFGDSAEEES